MMRPYFMFVMYQQRTDGMERRIIKSVGSSIPIAMFPHDFCLFIIHQCFLYFSIDYGAAVFFT